MIIRSFVAGLLVLGLVSSAHAQTVPDDVRCLILSNMFAKEGSDARVKGAAAQSLLYYVGRLEARANAQAITAAMRAQRTAIDARTAPTQMGACAARLQRAQQMIQAAGRAAQPPK
jgi:hypothetical protein